MKNQNTQPSSSPEKTSWSLVILVIGAGVVAAFQIGKAPPVLKLMQEDLGMNLFLAGWILSAFYLIGLVLGAPSGAVADAFGHRRTLLAGLLAMAAGSFAGVAARDAWFLLGSRILEGIGFLLVGVSAPGLIFKLTRPRDVRLAFSGWSCYVPGGVAAIMLVAPVLAENLGWRGLWLVNGFLLSGYAILVAYHTRGVTHAGTGARITPSRILRDFKRTATSAGPLLLALIFSTYALQWLAVMGFLPTLIMEDYGFDLNKASSLSALVVSVNVLGNLAGGWLMHRGFRRRNSIIAASLLMGLSSILIYASGLSFALRYGACLLFAGVGGLVPASLLSGAPAHAPTRDLVSTTTGLILQGSQLGQTVGPPALALLVSVYGGWHVAPWLLCATASVGILLSLRLAVLERAQENDRTTA